MTIRINYYIRDKPILKPYIKVIIAAFLIILACLGFGRFAFGMVLPNMQETLYLTTTQVGFIGTANFIGYIIGILFANLLYTKYTTHKLIFMTILLQGLCMLSMTMFDDYLLISLFYSFSGFCAAIVNMSLMAYIANVVPKSVRGKALGIVVSGSGLAIILSGQIVPFIENLTAETPWKISWTIFSFSIIAIAFLCQPGIKKHTSHKMPETKIKAKTYFLIPSFWKIGIIYMVFGITYVVYVTFFVSTVIDKYNFTTSLSGNFWALLGFCSIFSGFIFGQIADKVGPYKSLMFVYILQTIAHFILAIDINSYAIWISAILFGISVWSIPSIVTLLTSLHFDVKRTAQVLSLVTLLFASCQAIAPVAAGYIYDITNDFSNVFMITSILTLLAVIISFIFSKQEIKQVH